MDPSRFSPSLNGSNGYHAPGQVLDHTGQPARRYDQYPVSHVITYASVIAGAYRKFMHGKQDEAIRHNRETAMALFRDHATMALVHERMRSVASLPWHIEVDNEKDPDQKALKDGLTQIVQATPRLREMFWYLSYADWYGRYGAELNFEWEIMELPKSQIAKKFLSNPNLGAPNAGQEPKMKRPCLVIKGRHPDDCGHFPINGDKIGHDFNRESYVLVYGGAGEQLPPGLPMEWSTVGRAAPLRGWLRQRFIIHRWLEGVSDADFYAAEQADAINGVGLRSFIYFRQNMFLEIESRLHDLIEQSVGLRLWYYSAGNDASKKEVEEAALANTHRTNLLIPRFAGEGRGAPAEGMVYVDPPVQGTQLIMELMALYSKWLERMIVGQGMSGGQDNDNGLGGSGRAKFAANTKDQIIESDANGLAETLTTDWIDTVKYWTFPEWRHLAARLAFGLEDQEPKPKLEAAKTIVDMGAGKHLKVEEVVSEAGFTMAGPGDETFEAAVQPGMGLPGQPGAPGEDDPDDPDGDGKPGKPFPGKPGAGPQKDADQRGGELPEKPEAASNLEARGGMAVYAVRHAPAGDGIALQGKHFTPGEFIPADVVASLTPKEKAHLDEKTAAAKAKKEGGEAAGEEKETAPAEESRASELSEHEFRQQQKDYLRGDCFTLAVAVNEETGWPIEHVLTRPHFEGGKRISLHAVNRRPDGTLVDAGGEVTPEEISKRYAELTKRGVDLVPVSYDQAKTSHRIGDISKALNFWNALAKQSVANKAAPEPKAEESAKAEPTPEAPKPAEKEPEKPSAPPARITIYGVPHRREGDHWVNEVKPDHRLTDAQVEVFRGVGLVEDVKGPGAIAAVEEKPKEAEPVSAAEPERPAEAVAETEPTTESGVRGSRFVATPLEIPPGGLNLEKEEWAALHGPDMNIIEGHIADFPITTIERGLIEKVSKKTRSMLEDALSDPEIIQAMKDAGIKHLQLTPHKGPGKAEHGWTMGHSGSALMFHTQTGNAIEKSPIPERREGGIKRIVYHEAGHGLWDKSPEEKKKAFTDVIVKHPEVTAQIAKIVNIKPPRDAWDYDEKARAAMEVHAELNAMRRYDPKRYAELPETLRQAAEDISGKESESSKPKAKDADTPAKYQENEPPALYQSDPASEEPRKFSSTQFDLPENVAELIRAMAKAIPDDDLAEDGREESPHITIKYGLHTDDPADVAKAVRGFGPVKIRLGKLSIFPAKETDSQRGGDQYDVVKIEVEGKRLKDLNALISGSLEHTDTHPTYQPHVTLAYVKPGVGQKYVSATALDFPEIELTELVFSNTANGRTAISLAAQSEPASYQADMSALITYAAATEAVWPDAGILTRHLMAPAMYSMNLELFIERLRIANFPEARELYRALLDVLARYPDLRKEMSARQLSWMQGAK